MLIETETITETFMSFCFASVIQSNIFLMFRVDFDHKTISQ